MTTPPPPPARLPVPVRVRARPSRARSSWLAAMFAATALLLAGASIALYLTRGHPVSGPVNQGSPEEAVRGFLSAVFLADDSSRLATFVCTSWPPTDALTRTKAMVDANARISWDDLHVVSEQTTRAAMTARLGLRLPDDVQPSVYQQWHFTVVKESAWRVCDAGPSI